MINKIYRNYLSKKIFMMGTSHLLNIRPKYKKIKNINDLDYKIFSQNGEDGIIDYLLNRLKIFKPKFVEIGVGDYSECNTKFIFERTSAKGLIIDCLKNFKINVLKNIKLWRGDLNIVEKKIDSKNIISILKKNNFLKNIDLFSLDIDGIDYWVIEKLPRNFSKIAVLEYNSIYGPNLDITVPNVSNFDRSKYHYSHLCFGSSLKALVKIMKKKNFTFVGCDITRCNAFFVNNKYLKYIKLNIPDQNKLDIFTKSNIRESRNKIGKLSYKSGSERLKLIKNCTVFDLKNKKLKKIKDLFKFKKI